MHVMMQSQTMTKAVDQIGADHRGVQALAAEYECVFTLLKQLFLFFFLRNMYSNNLHNQ